MFNEVVLKTNLGCRLLPGHLVVGRLGTGRAQSIVAVSQSLDKLVVFDTAVGSASSFPTDLIEHGKDRGVNSLGASSNQEENQSSSDNANSSVYYITVKDVIRSISVQSIRVLLPIKEVRAAREHVAHGNTESEHADGGSGKSWQHDIAFKDLLLIGCSGSMLIYDSVKGSNLFTLSLPTSIHAIGSSISYSRFVPKETSSDTLIDLSEPSESEKNPMVLSQLAVCGGPQGLYLLRFDLHSTDFHKFSAELSSGRSTGDSICCLSQGSFENMELVITGCIEQKIRIYQLDLLEQNIQACKLTIEESAAINCLCSIKTENKLTSSETIKQAEKLTSEQMNYFSYGLESGFIGVYRLIGKKALNPDTTLVGERVWRQRCKFVPSSMLMYDIDGDGLDELVIGFRNGRIEARSPFTGQLLATTRCFKPTEKLVGMSLLDYHMDGRLTLLACSTSGQLFGFRPSFSKPHMALRGFNLPTSSQMRSLEAQQPTDPMVAFQLANSTSMNTINEEQESYSLTRDVFTKAWLNKDELHVQNSLAIYHDSSDELMTRTCEAKQSFELMQKIIALQSEQLDLEKKACRIYYDKIHQTSKCYPTDLSVVHRWDFDPVRVCLKLTVVITSNLEDVKLIKLKDETKNFLTTGCLIIKRYENGSLNLSGEKRSYVIVLPLRSSRDIETCLEFEIFCQSIGKDCSRSTTMSRMHHLSVHVPKFSMFSLFDNRQDEDANIDQASKSSMHAQEDGSCGAMGVAGAHIKISYRLKDESQLNKFKEVIELNTRGGTEVKLNYDSIFEKIVGSNTKAKDFHLQLIDLKHTIRRIFNSNSPQIVHDINSSGEISEKVFSSSASLLSISISDSCFTLSCSNSDVAVDVVQGLLIDQLCFDPAARNLSGCADFTSYLQPLENDLAEAMKNLRDLEESEKRIQTELFESSDYTKTLIQQLAIANDLNEFEIAKDLLNELSVMLSEAHNSARIHYLNSSRPILLKRVKDLEERINFLSSNKMTE